MWICCQAAVALAERGKAVDATARGVVLPAPQSPDPRLEGKMAAKAESLLDSLEYDRVGSETVQRVLRRANPRNVQNCFDKALVAIGRAVKADLVVCPRIVRQPRPVVKVTFGRVSKRRVWDCRRPLETKDGVLDDDYLDAVEFCMDQLLSSAPKTAGKARDRKTLVIERKKRERSRKNYLGAAALMVPAGTERFTAHEGDKRFSKHLNYDYSWGFGLFYERRSISWVSVGAEFGWLSLGKKKNKALAEVEELYENIPGSYVSEIDRLNVFNLDATLRLFYPGRWVEPYLKLGLGFSFGTAREGDLYRDVEVGSGFGANYQVRAGLMAIVSYLGIFAEIGFVDIMSFPGTTAYAVFDSAMLNEALLAFNVGLAAVF